MTKKELIKRLEKLDVPDDTPIQLADSMEGDIPLAGVVVRLNTVNDGVEKRVILW